MAGILLTTATCHRKPWELLAKLVYKSWQLDCGLSGGFGPEDILTLQSSRQTVLEKVTALSCGWLALLLPGVGALGTAEDRKGLWGQ